LRTYQQELLPQLAAFDAKLVAIEARFLYKRPSEARTAFGTLPRITFTDSRGVRWQRNEQGQIVRTDEEVPPWSEGMRAEASE
jgi:hypothetical protein